MTSRLASGADGSSARESEPSAPAPKPAVDRSTPNSAAHASGPARGRSASPPAPSTHTVPQEKTDAAKPTEADAALRHHPAPRSAAPSESSPSPSSPPPAAPSESGKAVAGPDSLTVSDDAHVGRAPDRKKTASRLDAKTAEDTSPAAETNVPAKVTDPATLPQPSAHGASSVPTASASPLPDHGLKVEPSIASGTSSSPSPAQPSTGHAVPLSLEQALPLAPVLPSYPAQPPLPIMAPIPSTSDLSVLPVPGENNYPAERANLLQQAVADSGLSMAVFPHAAHVSLVSEDGDLSLHVRVRDGRADVDVSGTMAPVFETKAPEVRTILAGEGLGLGSFATDQQGSHHHSQQGGDSASGASLPYSSAPKHQSAPTTSSIGVGDENHIHVTA